MMATNAAGEAGKAKPWYREPWPWILMAGPFIVILAGIYTAWLAVSSSDGLVSQDYYKQGLAAGETLARSRHAEELGLMASLRLTNEAIGVRLSARAADWSAPAALRLTLSHPTRAGVDQISQLRRSADGYEGALHLPSSGHWLVLIEDEERTWRLLGSVVLPAGGEIVIGGEAVAAKR